MGKKKPSGVGSEYGDDKASSTVSICGRSTTNGDFEGYSDEEEDEFAAGIEMLYEKRAGTRESGLQRLIRLLTSQWQLDECTFKQETLKRLFLGCFKRGAATESALAARALALHTVTLGASSEAEDVFQDSLAVFEPIILKGRSPSVRAAAVEALAIMCFVAAEGPEETAHVMEIFTKAFSNGPAPVQVEALKGWTLLFTTVPAWKLGGTGFIEGHLQVLAALLHSDDVDVRSAAGEAVTVIYHTCDLSALPDSSPPAEEDEEEGGDEEGKGIPGVSAEKLEDIVSRMQDLAKNRGDDNRRSKKDRASQRSTFRELSSILEDGNVPEQKVKLRHGDLLIVDTLHGNVQLNAFRSFLNEGFQMHLQQNPLLHQIFNFRPREEQATKLTATEKRLYRSPASAQSKERSQARKQDRRMMAAYKEGMPY